jgi:hypothetical protein
LPTTNVSVAYRPVRAAFLLRAGSLDDLCASIRSATELWGGVFSPILAVSALEEARDRISAFVPDVLVPVADDPLLAEVVAAHPHLAWPGIWLSEVAEA